MGIEIIIKKDTIDNLQDKLEGKIPVTYEDLLVLISSHGLYNKLSIKSNNKTINIESQYPSECYNLSKLDTSNITDMNHLFMNSMFNGDISNWNVSNVTNMDVMFDNAKSFNQNISSWNFDNIINCDYMFNKAKAFCDKYNNGNPLPEDTDKTKEWFNLNRERINMIEIKEKHGEEIDNFFSIINNNEIKKDK